MACHHPLSAARVLSERTPSGKAKIIFIPKAMPVNRHELEKVSLPCGQCLGCRIDNSRDWAIRCTHEASLYEYNCFLTLTYNDKGLDLSDRKCSKCAVFERNGERCRTGSLCKRDFQLFMKRLRKRFAVHQCCAPGHKPYTEKIRYYHCGEYGSKLSRPHHHAILFNMDFHDKYLWEVKDGWKLYRSPSLESLWPYGYSRVGVCNWETAAYVARYCQKKINGEMKDEWYQRVDEVTGEVWQLCQEYATMSRRPGIAHDWFQKLPRDVYPKDFVTHKGIKLKPPRYYDKIFDEMDPNASRDLKKSRRIRGLENSAERTPDRLRQREAVLKSRTDRLIRSYEDDY